MKSEGEQSRSSKVSYKILLNKAVRNPKVIIPYFSEYIRVRNNKFHLPSMNQEFKPRVLPPYEFAQRLTGMRPDFRTESLNKIYNDLKDTVKNSYLGITDEENLSIISFEDALSIYLVIKSQRPTIVLETGVSDGMSTSIILKALSENGKGTLHSIDLPEVGMPQLINKLPGWVIPENLKDDWNLYLGKSKKLLPEITSKLDKVDVFLHDSEHSYGNMLFEFETVSKVMPNGSVLLSDDALANNSIIYFSSTNGMKPEDILFTKEGLAGIRINRS